MYYFVDAVRLPVRLMELPTWQELKKVALAFWEGIEAVTITLWQQPVVQGALGLTALFLAYGVLYWLFLIVTRTYFVEIAPFRIWKDPAPAYLAEGLASRLVDELLCLQRAVRAHGRPPGETDRRLKFHKVHLLPPVAAKVTVEFKGISPEALHAFLRRVYRRHVLITCDAIPLGPKLRLLGRSEREGPWRVEAPSRQGTGELRKALQEFAVHTIVEVQPSSRKALANALAYRQFKAYSDDDHYEALRLAKLGHLAMPNHPVQFFNLGSAYQKVNKTDQAINFFTEAIMRDDSFSWAYSDLGIAYAQKATQELTQARVEPAMRNLELAEQNLRMALALDPDDEKIKEAHDRVREKLAGFRAATHKEFQQVPVES